MSTQPPALPPTSEQALREELARVRAQLAEYVGHEPTVAEEMRHLSDQNDLLRRVVAQHIADSYDSGSTMAADLARSLVTELETAGVDIDHDVKAIRAQKGAAS